MAHTGNYKQIFYTTNTQFSDTFDYLNGPFLMTANSISRDVLLESYETVKDMETDEEQQIENIAVYKKIANNVILGEGE